MKDYNEMSDFEINSIVAKFVSVDSQVECFDKQRVLIHDYHNGACLGWMTFDPCNNPSDMWPLIIENGICIHVDNIGENSYANTFDSHGYCKKEFYDKKPLRAAAIVYLMIKDAE